MTIQKIKQMSPLYMKDQLKLEQVNKNEKKLKQNVYNNNDNTAGLPKTNEEKRDAVKTGDNLFSKITLFTAILSIFGLSYLPFLKKKKIEINSED